jgi:hypothetical protein
MPDLLAVALVVIAGLVLCWGGRRLVDIAFDRRRQVEPPAPRREVDMDRLLEIAAVTDEEIIAAAEWWATHPDADEPSILRDLDPSAWTKKPSVPQVEGERKPRVPPPPPKPSKGGATTARGMLAPGMVIAAPADVEKFGERLIKELNGSRASAVIPASMEWTPLPDRFAMNSYADCQHEDADRAEIRSFAHAEPIKYLITYCRDCQVDQLKARLRDAVSRVNALPSTWAIDSSGHCAVTKSQCEAYERAVAAAQQIRQQIKDLERLNR